ncbi:hypothetical protein HYC85_011302 [Camellia sinensis]|uniref:Uncharacterized protein n=1 Tax=Camellia sinensis TaxID=4442 RepID=A0A7J7H8Y7_CAMSI|nr:hypothetical protein HYC85_011302 [Camellia sinensis]
MLRVTARRRILHRASSLRRCFRFLQNQILACTLGKSCTYMQLPHITTMSSLSLVALERGFETPDTPCGFCEHNRDSSDLTKYVGGKRQEEGFKISDSGLNQMDKTLCIGGAHIAYRIWEVAGYYFTLSGFALSPDAIKNQTTIPVLIGTKFDDFVQLPIDVQWIIASQKQLSKIHETIYKAYARALNATLFFSTATYNINVSKIFKFITAKLFNLPWAPERNLTIGEPIIDF